MPSLTRTPSLVLAGLDPLAGELAAHLHLGGRSFTRLASDAPAARRALSRAETAIVAAGPDTPAEIDRIATACAQRRARQPLRLILVSDREPASAPPAPPAQARLRIETHGIEEAAARALLTRWPLHAGLDPLFGQAAHLLVAGWAPPARALILQALRLMHYGGPTPVLTIASDAPERDRANFLAAHPQAEAIARLRFVTPEDPVAADTPPVTTAHVCLEDAAAGLALAERLAATIAERQRVAPPIHLEVGALEPRGGLDAWDGQLHPYSYRRVACHPEVLLDGRGDELARTIHAHYRDSIAAQGRDPDLAPAGRTWEALDDAYRRASRHQADHLWAKLALSDCRALPEELVETFTFSPLEVERLAEIEHDRWAADRRLAGWTHGPQRDDRRRHHPQLVPYAELSEPMKDLDRFAVRLAPVLLARYGRGLVRMLMVGLPEPEPPVPPTRALARLAEEVLERLVARYPDRSLVLAATLAGAASRAIVRRGIEAFGAGLFLLAERPLGETLAAQPDAAARRDLLGLVAQAERRIALPDPDALAAWFAERAEIELRIGAPAPNPAAKGVRIDLARGCVAWGFEY
jgi:hypothetical protein